MNSSIRVKWLSLAVLVAALAACRGESTPRDYQNAPPAMTHPPQNRRESPAANGMGKVAPQPTTGVEGTANPYKAVTPPQPPGTTTLPDTPPATPTNTTT